MNLLTTRWFDAAAETFSLRGPVYEFGFSPGGAAHGIHAGRSREGAAAGPTRVDRLEDLDRLPIADGAAATVVCDNALQYAFEPSRAAAEMTRILAPGGMLLVMASNDPPSSAVGRYWSVYPGAMSRLLSSLDGTLIGWIGADASPDAVFAIACKAPMPAGFAAGVQPFLARLDRLAADSFASPGVLGSLRGLIERTLQPQSSGSRRAHRIQYALHLPVDDRSRPALLDSCLPPIKTGTRLDLSD